MGMVTKSRGSYVRNHEFSQCYDIVALLWASQKGFVQMEISYIS